MSESAAQWRSSSTRILLSQMVRPIRNYASVKSIFSVFMCSGYYFLYLYAAALNSSGLEVDFKGISIFKIWSLPDFSPAS